MPYTVQYTKECECILVVITDELDLSLLQSMAAEVAKLVKETGSRCILNDVRRAQPTAKTIDIYNMPQAAKKAGVEQAFKRALVVGTRAKEFSFLETVFVNQGHIVRMIKTIEEAKKWLCENRSNQANTLAMPRP